MPTTVREIRPHEHDEVAELTASVFRGEGYSSADYEPALRDVGSRAASATVLVALLGEGLPGEGLPGEGLPDGRLVGAVTVATRGGPWAEQSAAGEAVLRMLVVSAQARGSGAGEALVRACLDRARSDGCTLVRLSSQEAMTAAHRLYERAGFTRTPSLDWSPVPGHELRTYALPLADWCGQCGLPLTPEDHDACRKGLDPPRHCPWCRRRMVVQVLPTGWTARCSEHGRTAG